MSPYSGRRRVLLATANPHKAAEVADILGSVFEITVQDPQAWETGSTFEANALTKAVAVRDLTGEIAVADDSGIEIDALGGHPGVYSSRWTNEEDWIPRVLREMHGVPMERRTCRYVCAAAVAFPDGTESVVRGVVEGYVAEAARGDGGFGYDPIMIPSEGDGRTFAEMSAASKHSISHRARAFHALADVIASYSWGGGGDVGADGGGGGGYPEEAEVPSSVGSSELGGDHPGGGPGGGGGGDETGSTGHPESAEPLPADEPQSDHPPEPASHPPEPEPHPPEPDGGAPNGAGAVHPPEPEAPLPPEEV